MKVKALTKSPMAILAAALLLSTACPIEPALAFRLPVGTVQAEKRLEPLQADEDVNEPTYDLTESPSVVSMIKLLAHFLPQQVYFLNSDPSPNYPSISIISLLIKLAAAAKMPDKSITARKEKQELNLPPPVINTDGTIQPVTPSVKAKKSPGKKVTIGGNPELNELDPEKTVRQETERKKRSIRSESLYDAKNLDSQEISQDTTGDVKLKTANLYTDFLSSNVRLNPPKENMQFLFWTCPQEISGADVSKDAPSENKFEGSFVVSQYGTRFKSVHGRQFTLDEGKLLACNRQAELSFQAPMAKVVLPPGTTALITLDQNMLTVQALESTKSSVQVIGTAAKSPANVESGQQVNVGSDGKQSTSQFSIAQLVQKERLADAQASYLNQQQASALSELLKRISASTTATGGGSQ